MQIGFIGLGNMGFGMASNLLKAGNELLIFDIDQDKMDSLLKLGGQKMAPLDMPGHVDIIILCLPHPKISEDVIDLILSKRKTVKTIIDTSTLTPDDSLNLYKRCKEKEVNFLCAPMLGGKNAAMDKRIHFLIEGDKQVFEENESIFSHKGMRSDYMGAAPSATLAKLAYNICRYSNLATAAEVSRLLRSYVTDTQSTYDLLTEGSLDNFGQVWAEDIADMVLNGNSYVTSNIPDKDLTLIAELQTKKKLSTKFISAIRDVYKTLG